MERGGEEGSKVGGEREEGVYHIEKGNFLTSFILQSLAVSFVVLCVCFWTFLLS